MRQLLGISLSAALLGVFPNCLGAEVTPDQTIVVRLIDPGSGRPVKGVRIWLNLGNPWPHGSPYLEERTGPDGTAVFHVEFSLPDQLFVHPPDINRVGSCSHGLFLTGQVVREGVVADDTCDRNGKRGVKFKAEPGEIIVFARKLKWWQRFQD